MSGRNGKTAATGQRRAEELERARTAWDLRLTGATIQQIADQLGLSVGGVHKILKREFKRRRDDIDGMADQYRQIELERLERLWFKYYPYVINGSPNKLTLEATDRLLKISKRRSEILGFDAPQKIENTGEQKVTITRTIVHAKAREETDSE
ncbi:hypothetical protein [Methylocaldum sp.]|uniref:hypothetical protein n=1 Tax=Methylocaldum sp. TaxID=1969727 RepID=UPI0032208E5E